MAAPAVAARLSGAGATIERVLLATLGSRHRRASSPYPAWQRVIVARTTATVASTRAAAAEAVAMATAKFCERNELPPWPDVLQFGCDDRIVLAPRAGDPAEIPVNQYFRSLDPPASAPPHRDASDLTPVFRASVTCNVPTARAWAAAKHAYDGLASGELTHEELAVSVRARLANTLRLPSDAAVFLAPSGSDAEFLPLLFTKALTHGGSVVNVVTCQGEIGRGCLFAASGELHSAFAPFRHRWDELYQSGGGGGGGALPGEDDAESDGASTQSHDNTLGLKKPSASTPRGAHVPRNAQTGQRIPGLADGVQAVAVSARHGPHGAPIDPAGMFEQVVEPRTVEKPPSGHPWSSAAPILHIVAGSKTGIAHAMPDETMRATVAQRGGMIVVDACQMRFDLEELASWLAADAVVIVTGSKYFRAPPFNAAVIVPGSVMHRIGYSLRQPGDASSSSSTGAFPMPPGLRAFFTRSDFPQSIEQPALQPWLAALTDDRNPGLLLRWEAALAEMEPTFAVPSEQRRVVRRAWRRHVVDAIERDGGGYVQACFLDSDATMTDVSVKLARWRGGQRVGGHDGAEDAGGERANSREYLDADALALVNQWMACDLTPALDKLLASTRSGLVNKILSTGDTALDAGDARLVDPWRAAAATPCFLGQPTVPCADVPPVLRIAMGSDTQREMIADSHAVAAQDAVLVRKLALCAVLYDELAAVGVPGCAV